MEKSKSEKQQNIGKKNRKLQRQKITDPQKNLMPVTNLILKWLVNTNSIKTELLHICIRACKDKKLHFLLLLWKMIIVIEYLLYNNT